MFRELLSKLLIGRLLIVRLLFCFSSRVITCEHSIARYLQVGQVVVIGAGTPQEEKKRIVGFGFLLFDSPLKFAHARGVTVDVDVKPKPLDSSASSSGTSASLASSNSGSHKCWIFQLTQPLLSGWSCFRCSHGFILPSTQMD